MYKVGAFARVALVLVALNSCATRGATGETSLTASFRVTTIASML